MAKHHFGQTITQATFTGLPDGYVAMDNIDVGAVSAPEPATNAAVGFGLAGLGEICRRRAPLA